MQYTFARARSRPSARATGYRLYESKCCIHVVCKIPLLACATIGYLVYKYTIYPIVARAWPLGRVRASRGILHTSRNANDPLSWLSVMHFGLG